MSASNLSLQRQKFSVAIQTDKYKKLINNTLSDPKRAQSFIASVSAMVAVNPNLQLCTAGSILSGALLGETLNLSPSPQMGHYYLVPYDVTVKDENGKSMKNANGEYVKEKRAQFQMGYKGYIQLAIRSGYYKRLSVMEVKEGELVKYDPIDETIELKLIENEGIREAAPTVGYYAMFEYHNGFRKLIYWTKKKMERHADKYSKAFDLSIYYKILDGKIPDRDMWKYSSFWYKNFDAMARKTMLRQLISKWGIMSVELQQVLERDMAVMGEDGTYEYDDNESLLEPVFDNPNEVPNESIETGLPDVIETDNAPEMVDLNDL